MNQIDFLRRQAELAHQASREASRRYDMRSWIRYTAVFFPVPLLVLLLRLELQPWGYYALGSALVVIAALMFHLDRKDLARREAAAAAADSATRALEEAQELLQQ